ncbi:uncharacterized protein ACJ7VT_016979 [Polymixia lowei]
MSTTMDDDVFTDGTLREEQKTPGSQEELSEKSVIKISPGSVRQEVSQAISDKRGTLIILKEAEDKTDSDGSEAEVRAEKGEPVVVVSEEAEAEENELAPGEKDVLPTIEEDASSGIDFKPTIDKMSPKMETKRVETTLIKGTNSPKRAKASWVCDAVKTAEESKFTSTFTKEEVKELKTFEGLQQRAEIFTFEGVQTQSSLATAQIVTESSTTSLAVPLQGSDFIALGSVPSLRLFPTSLAKIPLCL